VTPRWLMLMVNVALLGAWFSRFGLFSWPEGN
jgi:hypothetical protein